MFERVTTKALIIKLYANLYGLALIFKKNSFETNATMGTFSIAVLKKKQQKKNKKRFQINSYSLIHLILKGTTQMAYAIFTVF